MTSPQLLIVGGGLAGLSAGCFARASGFRTTILEHNLALGGVCAAWKRGPYTIDGCIHWLTGGAFLRVYEELGVLERLRLRPIGHLSTLRDLKHGVEVELTADLGKWVSSLEALSPADGEELRRIVQGARVVAGMAPPLGKPQELWTLRDGLRSFWEMREDLSTVMHFRKPMPEYLRAHVVSSKVANAISAIVPDEAPALVLLMMLGYLEKGWLSRPEGGTAAFRDALVASYTELGGESRTHATVDEVVVKNGRAAGARLTDGTLVEADAVICTASSPETIFRLLGGRYGAPELRRRMERWKMFTPIVLASYGVATPLEGVPQLLHIEDTDPIEVGGHSSDRLYLRICSDDPSLAPRGHSVVQALVPTNYDWWATRGSNYAAEKDLVGERLLAVIDRHLPGVKAACRVIDVATPLTFWNMARSWRGAFEGWMPNAEALFGHVSKKLEGLEGFYMAGQWVEPGGGVPTACASGRSAVQILCAEQHRDFKTPRV